MTRRSEDVQENQLATAQLPVNDNCKSYPAYPGSGTANDPYIVDWLDGDPENPRNWPSLKKWAMTAQIALGTFTVAFGSSCYSATVPHVEKDFKVSKEVAVLGLSLYVLGFGVGPLVFAPLSEMFGRRIVFLCTFAPFTFLHLGGVFGKNIATLLVTRFLAGTIGSSPMSNGGGAVSDIWAPKDRALATALYSVGPFLGPVSGPIVGGYISGSKLTWRFAFWIMFILSATLWIAGAINMSESYAPVLLRRRARKLSTDSHNKLRFLSIHDTGHRVSALEKMSINLRRPFVLLFTEPTVTVMSIYASLVYGTLYAFFSAYPIVFQQHRHFSAGKGGLAFLGIGLGNLAGVAMNPLTRKLYHQSALRSSSGVAPPEARLLMGIVGGIIYPIGLFWFAWTSFPQVPAIVPIAAGFPFGLGMLLVFNCVSSYLMDAYPLYCASALASTVVLRSILAALFPFFTPAMYRTLGDQWGTSIFAFVASACAPMPIMFYFHGAWIRSKSKYATKDTDDGNNVTNANAEKEGASHGPRPRSAP